MTNNNNQFVSTDGLHLFFKIEKGYAVHVTFAASSCMLRNLLENSIKYMRNFSDNVVGVADVQQELLVFGVVLAQCVKVIVFV